MSELEEAIERLQRAADAHPVRPDTWVHGPGYTYRISDLRLVLCALHQQAAPVSEGGET